jgi:hypothetical protein
MACPSMWANAAINTAQKIPCIDHTPLLVDGAAFPTHHGSSSYKYLGYFIYMQLDQYKSMVRKVNDACMAC